MRVSDRPWYTQTVLGLWENKVLFWSIVFGIAAVFPVIYIPVINTKVFLHKLIGWEWGLSIACTVFFWITAEAWKWAKRIYIRRKAANNGDGKENVLNENDPFLKYASFSRDNTMVV